jgi:hypothetical protein
MRESVGDRVMSEGISLNAYERVGLDPRWLFPDDGLQRGMLLEHCGEDISEEMVRDAGDYSRVARGLAIARAMGVALGDMFSEVRGGGEQRRSLGEIFSLLSGRGSSTARRLLKGMNIFDETAMGTLLHRTEELAEIILRREQGRARLSLDVELLLSISLAAGRGIGELVPAAERYAANAAAALLRIRVEGRGGEIEFEAAERIARQYPALSGDAGELAGSRSGDGVSRMWTYGRYMSLAAKRYFVTFPEEVGEAFFECVLQELLGVDERLSVGGGVISAERVREFLAEVGGNVGRAICGAEGFGRRPGNGS